MNNTKKMQCFYFSTSIYLTTYSLNKKLLLGYNDKTDNYI